MCHSVHEHSTKYEDFHLLSINEYVGFIINLTSQPQAEIIYFKL